MDLLNWVQTGGLPVKGERLQEMQTAYTIFNELGNLAGNLTILSGCVVTGTSVSDGAVFINGEVLKFKAGFIGPDVIIIQNESAKEFENGDVKAMHFERYATFGTAATSWLWDDFERPDPIMVLMARMATLEKKTAVFQAGGGMVLWNKPAIDIPTGWAEVVDWRGRMPVGFDAAQTEFDTMGKQGGAKNKTLSINEMPAHSHTTNYGTEDANSNGSSRTWLQSNSGTTVKTSSSVGGGQSFSILNPYRTVLFIEYIL
jgi:hypothetical protein